MKSHKFVYILFVTLLGLTACGRPPLMPGTMEGDGEVGRAAWNRVIKLQSLQATAVLSWKSIDSSHGKYKVRLSLMPPDNLKIEWLTPWGSVAGQLIMAADQFWFSNSRQRLTWHGQTADLGTLFQRKENRSWAAATQFFTYWPLLFSSPEEDDMRLGMQASIHYMTTDEGRFLNKVINFNDGDEMHIRLDDLVPVAGQHLFPRNIEALSHGGQIALTLKKFELQKELVPEIFIYSLKNFTINECSVPIGDNHGRE